MHQEGRIYKEVDKSQPGAYKVSKISGKNMLPGRNSAQWVGLNP